MKKIPVRIDYYNQDQKLVGCTYVVGYHYPEVLMSSLDELNVTYILKQDDDNITLIIDLTNEMNDLLVGWAVVELSCASLRYFSSL